MSDHRCHGCAENVTASTMVRTTAGMPMTTATQVSDGVDRTTASASPSTTSPNSDSATASARFCG